MIRPSIQQETAPDTSKKPNIVFILTDQWRAQSLGYSGDPNVETPRLDELAACSLNFKNTVSICPVCTPQRASLLTGKNPTTTGMFLNDLYLPAEHLTMGNVFKDAGYDTAYIGKWHLDGHGRASYIPPERRQGWDYWKVLECTHNYTESAYYAGDDPTKRVWDGYDAYAQTDDAIAYINDHKDGEKPFILFMGYGGPHFPHHNAPPELMDLYPPESIELRPNVPEEKQEIARKELQGYYGHCTAIDACVGRLFDTIKDLGLAEDTIFIFTSDHGDMHGSQGMAPKRKQLPWDESICVPFLCHYPSQHDKGNVIPTPVTTPDILPTLLSLAGIPVPGEMDGEDLSGFFTDEAVTEDRPALFMSVMPHDHRDYNPYRGIRTSRYSYVVSTEGPWLLYDNENDPYQMDNLVDRPEHAELQSHMDRELQRVLAEGNDRVMASEEAVARWGYFLEDGWYIGCSKANRVQSPGVDHGKPYDEPVY